MKKVLFVFVLVIIAVLSFQCQKNLSFIGSPDPGVSINPDPITANVQGNIVDENDKPAAGVTVTVGNKTLITDINGFFHVNAASLDKNTTLVTAQKDGYFKAYRVFAATSGCNQVVIKLLKRNLAGTVNSSSGGTVSLPDGSKISLPANAVVTASSASDYSGDIKVYTTYIDPTAQDIFKIIPGSLIANNKNGKRVLLSSFGMLAVELKSSAGEQLQIKTDNVATLTIPIPSSALAKAPATISLWYIDEKTGLWQEEGTATKIGNVYTGTVKHFSFWNCDYSNDAVNLSMTLKTPDSLPLVNAPVKITASNGDSTTSAYGWTDSLGQVKGLVPANQNLTLEIIDNCNYPFYQQNIAPLTQNTNLGTIIVNASGNNLFTIKGTLIDCSGNAVSNGYAIIQFDGFTHYIAGDASGNFITNLLKCPGTAPSCTIVGVNESTRQQGQEVSVSITPPQVSGGGIPVTNAGNITACGTSIKEFINFNIDGANYSSMAGDPRDTIIAFTYPDGIANHQTFISYGFYNINNYILFTVDSTYTQGTFSITQLNPLSYNNITLTRPFNVTFTSFPTNPGGFYEGNFSGQFTSDSSSVVHTINCTFKVKRDY